MKQFYRKTKNAGDQWSTDLLCLQYIKKQKQKQRTAEGLSEENALRLFFFKSFCKWNNAIIEIKKTMLKQRKRKKTKKKRGF